MNINTISELSEKLLDYFKSCLEKFSPTCKFAGELIFYAPFFKIYYEFCVGYMDSSKLHNELLKNK